MATDSEQKKNSAAKVPEVTGTAEVISLKDKGLNEIPIPSALSLRKRSNEYSHISNPRTVTLYTDEAIHVFEHEFRVAEFALRRLFYNYVTIDDPVISKTWETAVFNRLKEFFDGLKSAFIEMQTRFKTALENPENNIDRQFLGDFYFLAEKFSINDKTETDNPKTFEFSQTNPEIIYFLYCLKLYDRFGCLLRQVANSHAISSATYATIMQVWAREFQKVVRDIRFSAKKRTSGSVTSNTSNKRKNPSALTGKSNVIAKNGKWDNATALKTSLRRKRSAKNSQAPLMLPNNRKTVKPLNR